MMIFLVAQVQVMCPNLLRLLNPNLHVAVAHESLQRLISQTHCLIINDHNH